MVGKINFQSFSQKFIFLTVQTSAPNHRWPITPGVWEHLFAENHGFARVDVLAEGDAVAVRVGIGNVEGAVLAGMTTGVVAYRGPEDQEVWSIPQKWGDGASCPARQALILEGGSEGAAFSIMWDLVPIARDMAGIEEEGHGGDHRTGGRAAGRG